MLFVCWPFLSIFRFTQTETHMSIKSSWILLVTLFTFSIFYESFIMFCASIDSNIIIIHHSHHSLWNTNCSTKRFEKFLAIKIKNFAEKNGDVEAIGDNVSVQINPKVVHRGWFCAVKWFSQMHEKRFHSRVKLIDAMFNASLNQFVQSLGFGYISW